MRKKDFLYKVVMTCLCFATAFAATTANSASSQGPSGGLGGRNFYDTARGSESVSLLAIRSGSAVDSIRIGYVDRENGTSRLGLHHGGYGGGEKILPLGYGEEITALTGFYGNYKSVGTVVRYLTIWTNFGRRLTVGVPSGKYFSYSNPDIKNLKFDGIKGSSGSLIDSLGVYWERR